MFKKMRATGIFMVLVLVLLNILVCQPYLTRRAAVDKDNLTKIILENPPNSSTQFYFPMEKFRDTASYIGADTFINTWYSRHLYAMEEPIIYLNKSVNEIYRFTWLRTFHHPISIRLEKRQKQCIIYWKSSNGAGGYEFGELIINKKKTINISKWKVFEKMIENVNFWQLETNENTFGADGAQWILEAKVKSKYHVVDRQSPNKNSEYYRLCNYLINLTRLRIKEKTKY